MPRGARVRMLRTLTHTTYDYWGKASLLVYQKGEVVNLPYHIAQAFIRKGIAEHA